MGGHLGLHLSIWLELGSGELPAAAVALAAAGLAQPAAAVALAAAGCFIVYTGCRFSRT